MIEIAATITITVGSALLFAYWFRYTCLLILSAKTAQDHARPVAVSYCLEFPKIQSQLQDPRADLEGLRSLLDRDFAVLTALLKHSSGCSSEESIIEMRMLKIDYWMVGLRHRFSLRISIAPPRSALEEMSLVVEHLANMPPAIAHAKVHPS
jgi:hypothetical protein